MTFDWEVVIEGKSFRDLQIRDRVQSMKVTHQVPKGKKKKSAGHTVEIVLANGDMALNGYFRQLDMAKVWLGVNDDMYFQGKYRIKKVSIEGKNTEQPTLKLSLICVTFDMVRKYKTRIFEKNTMKEIVQTVAEDYGWTTETDFDGEWVDVTGLTWTEIDNVMRQDEVPSAWEGVTDEDWLEVNKSSHQSDHDLFTRITHDLGDLDMYMEYPEKVKEYEEPQPKLVIKKESYKTIEDPDGNPVTLSLGGDPNSVFLISDFSGSVDAKSPSSVKGGGTNDKGGANKPGHTDQGDTGTLRGQKDKVGSTSGVGTLSFEDMSSLQSVGPNQYECASKTQSECYSGETGPTAMVKKHGPAAKSQTALDQLAQLSIEQSKKAKLKVTPVLPAPYFFPRHTIGIVGIPEWEGVWEIEKVSHSFSGTAFLSTKLDLKKKSAGKKAGNKGGTEGNPSKPGKGEDYMELNVTNFGPGGVSAQGRLKTAKAPPTVGTGT